MPRNVEIKARLNDFRETSSRAAALASGRQQTVEQEDLFFNVTHGRLKLRILSPTKGQIIFYERPDRPGAKTSNYSIVETDKPRESKELLDASCGIQSVVRKTRRFYTIGRTRIHIDDVESLGHFLELEVVLGDGEDAKSAEAEAEALMRALGIAPSQLVDRAYVDLLRQRI